MIFVQAKIENFFRISTPIVWNLENQGLVLIFGENGAGKSTLFEALVWCLWGKTVRGYTGDAVVNRKKKKGCSVGLKLRHEGQLYFINRFRKHKDGGNGLHFHHLTDAGDTVDLTQGTATLTQAKIDSFLGIDYTTFVQGPMMPQGSFKKFSEMNDSEQKVVLESALQIGVLAAALDVTKDKLATAHQGLSAAQTALREQWLHYEALQQEKASYETERDTWARKKRHALSAIATELVEEVFEQEHYWAYSQTVNFGAAMEEARERTKNLKKNKFDLENQDREEATQYQSMLFEAKSDLKQAQADMARLKQEILDLRTLGSTCPTCYQRIDGEHVESCVMKIKSDLAEAGVQAEDARKRMDSVNSCLEEHQASFREHIIAAAEELTVAEEKILTLVTDAEQAKRWVDDLSASRRRESAIRMRFQEKQQEESPFSKLLQETERKILCQLETIAKSKSRVRGLQLEVDHLEFWRTGFSNKGLKSYILQSVTPFLNERVNYYAQVLTGGDIKVEFSTQTVLKSGEIREKFSVVVTNRIGADTYAGNSGGEKSRADLAINYTLSDLVSARARRPFPQRFLDEPFESLDESGVESVMELLADMVLESGSIFVVTHQDVMKGLFNKQIKVEKVNGETRIAA